MCSKIDHGPDIKIVMQGTEFRNSALEFIYILEIYTVGDVEFQLFLIRIHIVIRDELVINRIVVDSIRILKFYITDRLESHGLEDK
jgi:hypothetical protein